MGKARRCELTNSFPKPDGTHKFRIKERVSMSLPIRTTLEDVIALCNYFATKPTGATLADAKKVLDSEILHGMKISAMKSWGILEEVGDRFKILEIGRAIAKGNPEQQTAASTRLHRQSSPLGHRLQVPRATGHHRGRSQIGRAHV